MRYEPFFYQKKALDYILNRDVSMLMFGGGMGSTSVALTVAIELLYERFRADKILIVTSRAAVFGKWECEMEKWDHLSCLKAGFIRGSDMERKRVLSAGFGLYFITHESFEWLDSVDGFPFSNIIIDGFHLYSNPGTKRFKHLIKIRQKLKFILALSSLSFINHIEDLWGQLFILDGGKRLESGKGGFYDRYYFSKRYKTETGSRVIRELKEGSLEHIRERIKDICFIEAPSLIMASKARRYCIRAVEMNEVEYSKYKIIDKGILSLGEMDERIEKESYTIKKMQAANGMIYDSEENVHVIHTRKVEELKSILKSTPGERVLVAHYFRHEREVITRHVPYLDSIEGYNDINKWNHGEKKAALISVGAFNRFSAGIIETDILIWFSLPWSFALYEKVNSSVLKKTGAVIYHLIMRNTIDEELMQNIEVNRKRCLVLGELNDQRR